MSKASFCPSRVIYVLVPIDEATPHLYFLWQTVNSEISAQRLMSKLKKALRSPVKSYLPPVAVGNERIGNYIHTVYSL